MKSIIFSSEMIKGILEGRKTQTRRVIKDNDLNIGDFIYDGCSTLDDGKIYHFMEYLDENKNPTEKYYNIGKSKYNVNDIIYVKESFWIHPTSNIPIIYKADCDLRSLQSREDLYPDTPFKSPLFMPEKYSRIKLKIIGVDIQRLQDISPEDCIKEGIKVIKKQPLYVNNEDINQHLPIVFYVDYMDSTKYCITKRDSYKTLINSIHKKDIWNENPFVFVYDFEVVEINETN